MEVVIKTLGPSNQTEEFAMKYSQNFRQAIRQTFFRMGKELKQKTSQDILKGTKTGWVYWVKRKGKKGRWHQSSAPGETHANLTGALRKSIGWKVSGTDSMEFGYGVTRPTTPYARRIEEGGTDSRGITIKPRPSLKNNVGNAKFEPYFFGELDKLASK